MRNLVADLFISLDGFASGTNEAAYFGYDGLKLLSWVQRNIDLPQVILIGRNTYVSLAGFAATAAIVESILLKDMNELEPILTRHGYNAKGLAEQFNTKPADIRSLFRGELDPVRTRELHSQMLATGPPLY